jgi:hypothetical protein
MWRQGDIYVARVKSVPKGARALPHCVLAEGEATGHSHRVAQPGVARLFHAGDSHFLDVTAGSATVVHDEHGPISLPRGVYRVWRQREYTPQAIRLVRD